jgi:hypothetical protein
MNIAIKYRYTKNNDLFLIILDRSDKLANIIKPIRDGTFSLKNNNQFLTFLKENSDLSEKNKMISFDIVSLFTNIPVNPRGTKRGPSGPQYKKSTFNKNISAFLLFLNISLSIRS